jgi:hypothetical protein
MKRYIICVPQLFPFNNGQSATAYSIEAESPKQAARALLNGPRLEHSKQYINGKISVVEAKAGRLDTSFNHYSVEELKQ